MILSSWRSRFLFLSVVTAFCLLTLLPPARAANVQVVCPGGGPGAYSSINATLSALDPHGPNTITVSGACKENVSITSFDRLTLVGQGNTSVTDNSGGTAGVITIGDSQRVSIQGLTINGGGFGVACWDHSLCRFSGNTIQGAGGSGVIVTDVSHAIFNGDIIQSTGGNAVDLFSASEVRMNGATIRGSRSFAAVFVRLDSYFDIQNTTIQDNEGDGVLVDRRGTMRMDGSTISSNRANGISVGGQFHGAGWNQRIADTQHDPVKRRKWRIPNGSLFWCFQPWSNRYRERIRPRRGLQSTVPCYTGRADEYRRRYNKL